MSNRLKEITWDEAVELCSPYPYVLAVTIDKNKRPNIIGLGWWTFTSIDPKMVAISIGKQRYSHECIEYCKEFVLCFPSKNQKKEAWFCGTNSGIDVDKFQESGFKKAPSKIVKPPIIKGSTVAYECKVVKKVDTGDHTLYIGEVMAIHGIIEKPDHLYTIGYSKLIDLSSKIKEKN
jgi:flavin reductase (DIM6/NTAB) family NADH-FMN oxidoreductase RutF